MEYENDINMTPIIYKSQLLDVSLISKEKDECNETIK